MNRRAVIKTSIIGLAMLPAASAVPSASSQQPPQRHRVAWRHDGEALQLALTRQPAPNDAILYVHGATFPAALSVGWRMDGESWLDNWQKAGFDAWALDFAGYGYSDRPRVFDGDASEAPPFGRCAHATAQISNALRYIRQIRPGARIHLVAHSWGTLPAQQTAIHHPELVSRLVLFGPIAARTGPRNSASQPAWSLLGEVHQRPRQRTGLPESVPTPVSEAEIDRWCAAYLDSDSTSTQRAPRSVKVPGGPSADIDAMWSGESLVESSHVRQPTLILRGEWDHVTTDADAKLLYDALSGTPDKRDVKISGGNHWLHLQPRRKALWSETLSFLREGERADV